VKLFERIGAIILVSAILANAGCASVYYYGQAVGGQLRILTSARDIDHLIEHGGVSTDTAGRLELIRDMRRFAIESLGLPDNDSYRRYVHLNRDHVVWNVIAAPEFSTTAKTWCFPVAGCVGYRGYFSERAARSFGARLVRDGLDVFVGGVDAYSTLGHFPDPVLSSFIHYSELDTAALLFHELAHQLVYVKDDTAFNESFATAVERVGVARWVRYRGDDINLEQYYRSRELRDAITALMLTYRERLDELYKAEHDDQVRRAAKHQLLDELFGRYGEIRTGFGVREGTGLQRVDINNALISSFDLYHRFTAAFETMLQRRGGDLELFYDDVRELAGMEKDQRDARLELLQAAVVDTR
jgi:predicted aminopeptidase